MTVMSRSVIGGPCVSLMLRSRRSSRAVSAQGDATYEVAHKNDLSRAPRAPPEAWRSSATIATPRPAPACALVAARAARAARRLDQPGALAEFRAGKLHRAA